MGKQSQKEVEMARAAKVQKAAARVARLKAEGRFKEVNRSKKTGVKAVRAEETYFGGRQADMQAKRQARIARAEARRDELAAFADRQLTLALNAPHIVNDKANGGLDAHDPAKAIAYLYVEAWGKVTRDEAGAAGKTRLNVAVSLVNAELRKELTPDAFKAQFDARGRAMLHAHDAINYGFSKAKQGA